MANKKTQKKKAAEMQKICKGCVSDPESCIYLRYRMHKDSCMWRKPQ